MRCLTASCAPVINWTIASPNSAQLKNPPPLKSRLRGRLFNWSFICRLQLTRFYKIHSFLPLNAGGWPIPWHLCPRDGRFWSGIASCFKFLTVRGTGKFKSSYFRFRSIWAELKCRSQTTAYLILIWSERKHLWIHCLARWSLDGNLWYLRLLSLPGVHPNTAHTLALPI